jgi:hypothetical protein
VRNKADLHLFYDQFSAILDTLAERFGVCFVASLELPGRLSVGLADG